MRKAQRKDLDAYARAARDFWRGIESEEAIAAGRNMAELAIFYRRSMLKDPDKDG